MVPDGDIVYVVFHNAAGVISIVSTNACSVLKPGCQSMRKNELDYPSPSREDGISPETEELQLSYGTDLITEAGHCLRLPQVAIISAQTVFQRFYFVTSLKAHGHVWIAAAALLVACKMEEHHRKIRDIATVVHYCFCVRENVGVAGSDGRPKPLDYYGQAGFEWKQMIVVAERHLLKELGFQLFVDHPHKYVLVFTSTLRDKVDKSAAAREKWKRLQQASWNLANDIHRFRLPIFEPPEAVACACIILAAEETGQELPPGWPDVFGADQARCAQIVEAMGRMRGVGSTCGDFEDIARCGFLDQFEN